MERLETYVRTIIDWDMNAREMRTICCEANGERRVKYSQRSRSIKLYGEMMLMCSKLVKLEIGALETSSIMADMPDLIDFAGPSLQVHPVLVRKISYLNPSS